MPKLFVTTTRPVSVNSSVSTSTELDVSHLAILNIVSDLLNSFEIIWFSLILDLLEKSRVIRQAPGERCYHIFYQIFSDQIKGLKDKLKFTLPLKDYWFVAQAELSIDGVNDQEEAQLTDEAFDILNFSQDEKMDCYKLMSGIMHMGNMKFKQRPREEQAEADGEEEAGFASEMYGVEVENFLKSLTKPRVRVGTEWVSKGQNLEQVNWQVFFNTL